MPPNSPDVPALFLTCPDAAALCDLKQVAGGIGAEYTCRVSRRDTSVELRIVRRRRKTMALYVERDRPAELRVPIRCPWRDIDSFVAQKFDWLLKAREEIDNRPPVPVNCYEQGGEIRFLGKFLRLDLIRSRHRVAEVADDSLMLACRQPGNPAVVEKRVQEWYRRQAENLFPERLQALNAVFGDDTGPAGCRVRKMKARWGSCATTGEICLNLLLVQEALPQIDFVVTHELCHLRHFAHNASFYGLMDRVMPDWRAREAALASATG